MLSWLASATTANQPYLQPDPEKVLQYAHGDVLDLDHVRSIACGAGLDVLVLDQTRANIGSPSSRW